MSWAIERYLQKYNIGYVNVQFPSKAQMINGILAACATMLIALWFAPYYQTLTKQGKRGLIQKFIIYAVGYTILFIGVFLSVAFLTLKGLGIADIGNVFISFIREPSNIFAMFTCAFLLAIATGCCEWLIRKGKIIKLPHLLIIFAIIAMYAVMLLQIINKSESTLHTVHIQVTDERKHGRRIHQSQMTVNRSGQSYTNQKIFISSNHSQSSQKQAMNIRLIKTITWH